MLLGQHLAVSGIGKRGTLEESRERCLNGPMETHRKRKRNHEWSALEIDADVVVFSKKPYILGVPNGISFVTCAGDFW